MGLIFSKALFEGLVYGEAICVSKNPLGLYWEENMGLKIRWASLKLEGHFCQ